MTKKLNKLFFTKENTGLVYNYTIRALQLRNVNVFSYVNKDFIRNKIVDTMEKVYRTFSLNNDLSRYSLNQANTEMNKMSVTMSANQILKYIQEVEEQRRQHQVFQQEQISLQKQIEEENKKNSLRLPSAQMTNYGNDIHDVNDQFKRLQKQRMGNIQVDKKETVLDGTIPSNDLDEFEVDDDGEIVTVDDQERADLDEEPLTQSKYQKKVIHFNEKTVVIDFPEKVIPKQFKIKSVDFPFSDYNVNETCNKFYWKISQFDVREIELELGNYKCEELVEELERKMNETVCKKNDKENPSVDFPSKEKLYIVHLNKWSQKVTIKCRSTNPKNKVQLFEILFSKKNNIGQLLGFEDKDLSSTFEYTSKFKHCLLKEAPYVFIHVPEIKNFCIGKVINPFEGKLFSRKFTDDTEEINEEINPNLTKKIQEINDFTSYSSLSISFKNQFLKPYKTRNYPWNVYLIMHYTHEKY